MQDRSELISDKELQSFLAETNGWRKIVARFVITDRRRR